MMQVLVAQPGEKTQQIPAFGKTWPVLAALPAGGRHVRVIDGIEAMADLHVAG